MTKKGQAKEIVGLEGNAKKFFFRRLWVENRFNGPVGNTREGCLRCAQTGSQQPGPIGTLDG